MKTLALLFLVLAGSAFAQTGDPGLDSLAAYHATAERDYEQRAAIANAKVTNIQLSNGAVCRVAIIAIQADGLLLRDAANTPRLLPSGGLGLEDRVRFGYGTAEEVAAVEKIKAQREKARLAAEQLEIQRQQVEATRAISEELHQQEVNRLIFGR